jgi:hypothetical protein
MSPLRRLFRHGFFVISGFESVFVWLDPQPVQL